MTGKSNELYQLFVDRTREYAIFLMDVDGRITTWNEGAADIFGYEQDEVVGRSGAVIYTEEDVKHAVFEAELEGAAQEGHAADNRWHRRKDGSVFWGQGIVTAFRADEGALRGFAKIVREATEEHEAKEALRRSEERFRTLSEALPQIVWVADEDGTVRYVNGRFEEYTGRDVSEGEGEGWKSIVHPDDLETTVAAWREALESGGEYQVEHRLWGRGNSYRWFLSRALPLLDGDGDIDGWFGTATDIHVQKEASKELVQLKEALEERVRRRTKALEEERDKVHQLATALTEAEQEERQRIAHILHDDLQQILFGIELSLRQLRQLLDGDEAENMLDEVRKMLSEAMESARTLSVELSPPVLDADNVGLLLEWLALHMQERHQLRIALDVKGHVHLPRKELRVLLFHVAREMLFNVVKHAGVDRAEVEAIQDEDYLRLKVTDRGQGFDPSVLTAAHGTGFGLATLRDRLQLVGGRLEVNSAPGEGTTAVAVVPLDGGDPQLETDGTGDST